MPKKSTTYSLEKKHFRDEHDCCDIILTAQSEHRIPISSLTSVWKSDKDSINKHIIYFLSLNKKNLSFLGITATLSTDNKYIEFKTENHVGCIPIFSPATGKTYANLIVNGRLHEDIGEILSLIDTKTEIIFDKDLKLANSTVKPPTYFECAKFIDKYIEAKRIRWTKFKSENVVQPFPTGSTDWGKYAISSIDPRNKLKYHNRKNTLTIEHSDWKQINYVFKLCEKELSLPSTPKTTQRIYHEKILKVGLDINKSNIETCNELKIRMSDPVEIKELKIIGNRVLESLSSEYSAWSMDFSKLYEEYIQYIFKNISDIIGGRTFNNIKYAISGNRTSWDLSYIEPDIILKTKERLITIDAKYKMHMISNSSNNSTKLHEAFRSDLHQVLAYSTFSTSENKEVMLAYPSNEYCCKIQEIKSSQSPIKTTVYIIGVPFGNTNKKDTRPLSVKTKETINNLASLLS